jgi:UDP-glucose 4-epimerase
MSETSETFASNAYTAMKLFCEKMIDEFCQGNQVHLDILRSGHLYGEGDDVFNKLIPNVFRSLFGDYEFELQIGLAQELNLLYVKDAAKIICEAAYKDFGGGVTNLVSSYPVTLSYLLETIQLTTSKRLKVTQISRHIDNSQYSFQASRLHGRVEFVETPLETGLREVCKSWESRQK